MKKSILAVIFVLFSTLSHAVRLTDYSPYAFEVLFTNPVCETYQYERPVISVSGKTLVAKPQGVYCKPSDEDSSVSLKDAPQFRLLEWMNDSKTTEIYAAYLSFSSKNIVNGFCNILRRGVKVKLILDGGTGPQIQPNKDAEALRKCGQIELTYRGSTGGLGFAHNKIMIINPLDPKVNRIVFSSGNLTSGTSTNHENWNFVTTSSESYFAKSHVCVINAMIKAGNDRKNFESTLNNCRSLIKNRPETDVSVFFSPVDGQEALEQVAEASKKSQLIEAMSHRFSGALASLYADLLKSGKKIKFILDDDIYWAKILKRDIGRNTKIEAFKIYSDLINYGMNTRFLETNQSVYQLQHNKFMIFTFNGGKRAVFTGAGNMTTAAFSKNFENFYYIKIPTVVAAYKKQYDVYFNKMATAPEDMPRDYVLP